ncbi:hypothetical protein [Cupriavidus sp. 8B]
MNFGSWPDVQLWRIASSGPTMLTADILMSSASVLVRRQGTRQCSGDKTHHDDTDPFFDSHSRCLAATPRAS